MEWLNKAKLVAYGFLKLKPDELDEISIMDFDDMLEAHKMAVEQERWAQSYFVSCMMSVHLKKGISASRIVKPFLEKKPQKGAEAEAFWEDWERQRREAMQGEKSKARD